MAVSVLKGKRNYCAKTDAHTKHQLCSGEWPHTLCSPSSQHMYKLVIGNTSQDVELSTSTENTTQGLFINKVYSVHIFVYLCRMRPSVCLLKNRIGWYLRPKIRVFLYYVYAGREPAKMSMFRRLLWNITANIWLGNRLPCNRQNLHHIKIFLLNMEKRRAPKFFYGKLDVFYGEFQPTNRNGVTIVLSRFNNLI